MLVCRSVSIRIRNRVRLVVVGVRSVAIREMQGDAGRCREILRGTGRNREMLRGMRGDTRRYREIQACDDQ